MTDITYNQALTELETILSRLRSDSCDVDTLTASTRRAVELLNICRSKLTATESELQQILVTLQPPQA